MLILLIPSLALAQAIPVTSFLPVNWQGCGTATASTGDVAIKSANNAAKIYVLTLGCQSSDADNATNINFKNGSSVIWVGGVSQMATASDGSYVAPLISPLIVSKGSAFNFNTDVSTSSVVCCATGYLSTN